ncbi:unnamed protein product [Rangifer tarandus platyrhynchus]|uniref:Uncharacterized protein n=1 Tax=Rangifer tarandus platyrhynchus TaxID=3082113 RepID=A0AC59ZX71_RANTA
MMPAPRSPHMLTACVWPAGRAAPPGCARGQAAPDHAGARPGLPGKVNRRRPAPTRPRAAPHPAARGGGGGAAGGPAAPGSARGSRFLFKRLRRTRPAPSAAAAGGRQRSGAGGGPPAAPPPPPPPPPPRVRRAPPPPAPPPRARPAQAARVCFAARPPPPPPRASRAHLCLAGPHSSLPSVECLSRWLLRTVWLFPLVTAFTFCLNSSPARALPPRAASPRRRPRAPPPLPPRREHLRSPPGDPRRAPRPRPPGAHPPRPPLAGVIIASHPPEGLFWGWLEVAAAAAAARRGISLCLHSREGGSGVGGHRFQHQQQQLVIGGTRYSVVHPHINALPMMRRLRPWTRTEVS